MLLRSSVSFCALLAVIASAAPTFAQTGPGQPAPSQRPCEPWTWPPCTPTQQQPGQQYQQQYPQQPGQYQQQQPGQYQQQQPGQFGQYQQPYQQQPGQYGQYGQYQQQPGEYGQWQLPQRKPKPFESTLGFMLRAGGNLWTKPDNINLDGDPNYSAAGFAGSAGGFGWGASLYYEARIYQYFGLELDFGYDQSELHRNLDYNIQHIPFKVQESVTASGIRWGFLAKAIAPLTKARLWAGLGFERVAGSSTSGKLEITGGTPDATTKSELVNSIHATSKYSTMFDLALGVVAELSDHVDLPIELRAAKNLNQASNWKDRVAGTSTLDLLNPPPPNYTVTVQSSWDFRLGLGLGYHF